MPHARGWYVEATRYAFPYSVLLASGPFDDHAAAYAEMYRIRGLYPEAHMSVVLKTGKTLPLRTPRRRPVPSFDLSVAQQRWEAADAIAAAGRALGAQACVARWEDEQDVGIRVPFLSCNIWTAWTPAAPMPIISWRAAPGLTLRQHLRGAWSQLTPYAGRHGKATSLPGTWLELFEALEIGVLAGIDGTAFE